MSATPLSREDLIEVHERLLEAMIRFWQAERELLAADFNRRVVACLEEGDREAAESVIDEMEKADLTA